MGEGRQLTRREAMATGAKLAGAGASLWALGLAATPAARASSTIEVSGPPYDFKDQFYQANGIDPAKIVMRANGAAPDSTSAHRTDPFPGFLYASDTDPHANRRVRLLNTTGGYAFDGSIEYYNIFGMLLPDSFTNNQAGRDARELADTFFAYIFPKAAGDPFSPDPSNRRQNNVFGDPDPFYGFDVLGIWTIAFVRYTRLALHTDPGRDVLAKLARRNGRDLDGTPVIKRVEEVDFLRGNGLVEVYTRPLDGSLGPPWVI